MRGIAEIHLVAVNANPSRAQAAGDVATNRGRQHRDDHEIKPGTDLESRGRNARTAPRRNNGETEPNAKRENNKCQSAADDGTRGDGGPGNACDGGFPSLCPGLNDYGIDHDVLPALSRTFGPRAELMSTGNKGSDRSAWHRQERKPRN